MTQHELLETKTLAEVGEDIGLAEGIKLVKAFTEANPDATKGYYIGRNIIDQILAQPGCVGINFRKCLTELNQEHLVYTGVDACLLYTSPSPRDGLLSRMPSSA